MKYFTKKIISLTMISFIFSCAGQNSNPLEKYPGLKSSEPSQHNLETQTIANPDLFDITVIGSHEINQGQFIEGQPSQTLIRVITKSTKILSYKIEMIDFSSIERPTLVNTETAHIYSLQWTPPIGLIPGGQIGKPFAAEFLITVTNAEDNRLNGLTKTQSIVVVVNRNDTQPKIIGRTDLKSGVKEGVKTSFSVDIEDAAGVGSPRLPEIQITPYIFSNTEAYRANASQYLIPDETKLNNPEKIGANRFRFYYLLDIDRLPLNRDRSGHEIPLSPTVDICFQMRAISAVATLSDQIQVCTTASYAAQAPQFIFNDSQLKMIKSGEENIITFKIRTEHLLSTVTFKKPLLQISALSGQKEIDCTYENLDKKNELLCVLKWTPSCQKTDLVKILTLKADNDLGEKTKSTIETKEITVLSNPELCFKSKEGGK